MIVSDHVRVPYPQWLVSVRNIDEAEIVLRYGVDIIDWKEPRHGSLAAVSLDTLQEAAEWIDSVSPPDGLPEPPMLSAALGEPDEALAMAGRLPSRFRFAKVGSRGMASHDQLRAAWQSTIAALPEHVEFVPVAYADHQAAGSLPCDAIFQLAGEWGLRRIVLDTFCKDGRSSCALLGDAGLRRLGRVAADNNLWWSLAGKITLTDADSMWSQNGQQELPNCLAVRGAVCDGARTEQVSPDRLDQWRRWLMRSRGISVVTGEQESSRCRSEGGRSER